MSLDITKLSTKELISAAAEFVRDGHYLFTEEIADALEDGTWIEYFNGINAK